MTKRVRFERVFLEVNGYYLTDKRGLIKLAPMGKTFSCPHCQGKISLSEAMAILGRQSRGVAKKHTQADRERRREQLAKVRKLRWAKKLPVFRP